MRPTTIFVALSCIVMLSACGGPGDSATVPQAQPAGVSFVDVGDHVIHFSAQSTDHLPPEIARAYNIVRSKNRAMVNVSIISEATGTSVEGEVEVKTVNLTGQLKNVTMRKIQEQDAIYYIGETPVANRETLVFDITVRPEGVDVTSDVRFARQFYTN